MTFDRATPGEGERSEWKTPSEAEIDHLRFYAQQQDAKLTAASALSQRYREALERVVDCDKAQDAYNIARQALQDAADGSGIDPRQALRQRQAAEEGEPDRMYLGIDGTMGDAQDVNHQFLGSVYGPWCRVCGLARRYRRHDPTNRRDEHEPTDG